MIEVKFTCLDKADEDNDVQKLIAKVERYKVNPQFWYIKIYRDNRVLLLSFHMITMSFDSLQTSFSVCGNP